MITGDRFNGVNTPTLTISSVTQDDEDEYYCTASYGVYVNGTSHVAESEKATVVVFGMNMHVHVYTLYKYFLFINHWGYISSGICIVTSFHTLIITGYISRHTVVCRAAKKAGDHTVSIFTGRKKTAFSRMHSSTAPSPKHTIFAL